MKNTMEKIFAFFLSQTQKLNTGRTSANMRINIFGGNWKDISPTEGENWGCNFTFFEMEQKGLKVDKIFMMDGIDGQSRVRQGWQQRQDIVDMMNARSFEFITPEFEEGVNKSFPYPLHKIKERYDILYFKSTFAFMLAYAAMIGVKEVHLYGVYQSDHVAYVFER